MSDISILSLSSSSWSYPYWTSRQFLMYELAGSASVIYATGRQDLRGSLLARRENAHSGGPPFSPPPTLEVLSPLWPRIYRYPWLDYQLLRAYVRRLQKRLDGGRKRVVYGWHPRFVETIRALSYDILIYHPYDMFRHFVNSSDELVRQEDELCALADAVVTPHARIADALGHPNTHVIANGLFLPAFPDPGTVRVSEKLAGIGRPIIGNLGVINDKIDFELLRDVFARREDWQLVFVGFEGSGNWKASAGYRDIRALRNVHFLEGVPIDKVAPVIAGFDVGIIPYGLSGWAKFIESPLKLYQYWAMGVPVVSSALPALESKPGTLEVCVTPEDWQAGIEKQLACRGAETAAALRRLAEGHDWAPKARQVIGIIDSLSA